MADTSWGPALLYDNLQRLMKQGLVEEVAGQSDEDNSRRRYYRLSGLGRGVFTTEIDRLRGVVDHAEAHLKSLRSKEGLMLRWLYIQIILAHPAAFRHRFGDEMLEAFDRAADFSDQLRLLIDGVGRSCGSGSCGPNSGSPGSRLTSRVRPTS